jgi:hypothetical protein
MKMNTYNAIMQFEDQFISNRSTTFGMELAILADDKETIDAVTTLARADGMRVKKTIIGKGTSDAEMHVTIR